MTDINILDVSSIPIKAACHFPYKGYIISVSTIFRPHGVAIWHEERPDMVMHYDTVQEAINAIHQAKEEAVNMDLEARKIPTLKQLAKGCTVYISAHHSTQIDRVEVIGLSYPVGENQPFMTIKDGYQRSLADRGYPGLSYDDRPNQVWTTPEAAEEGLALAQDWWRKSRQVRSSIPS